jgi:hypothetical protein
MMVIIKMQQSKKQYISGTGFVPVYRSKKGKGNPAHCQLGRLDGANPHQ